MSLAPRVRHAFPSDVRDRGSAYFLSGQVTVDSGSPSYLHARVEGTEVYDVSLTAEPRALHVACSCPFAEENGLCKHIWATVLAADESAYLRRLKSGRGELHVEEDSTDYEDEEDDGDDDDLDDDPRRHAAPPRAVAAPPRSAAKPPATEWAVVLPALRAPSRRTAAVAAPTGEIGYFIDAAASRGKSALVLETRVRCPGRKPAWQPLHVSPPLVDVVSDPDDRAILAALSGASAIAPAYSYYGSTPSASSEFQLSRITGDLVLPTLGRTGRLRLLGPPSAPDPPPLRWDEGEPWQLRLRVVPVEEAGRDLGWDLVGTLRRGADEMRFAEPDLLLESGVVVARGSVARFDDGGAASWLHLLQMHGRFRIPAAHRHAFIEEIYALPRVPALDLPEGWSIAEEAVTPTPRLLIRPPREGIVASSKAQVFAELSFDYGGLAIPSSRPGRVGVDIARWRLVLRDAGVETAARARLAELDVEPIARASARLAPEGAELQLKASRLPAVVQALLAEGWPVEASGKLYRRPGSFRMGVTSGIDWFDLHATVDFEGVAADLSALLDAIKKRQGTVVLGDGSLGVLPEEWLARYGLLADLATVEDGHLRFKKSQIGLLDALLAAQPEVDVDAAFARARREIGRAATLVPVDPPASFDGELRPYQREGLGWLELLARLGFGGCLADDMGLGKTVQVLALLAARAPAAKPRGRGGKKRAATPARPSLVVAPRSLVFNWKREAARFTPALRVLDHTGAARLPPGEHFERYDMVLTTYGTLRRDAAQLAEVVFDYAILDEAQAIKNDRSETAKAARLLRADHRLALSGTPIENHLGELWSLFEYLNPGVLGRATAFRAATGASPSPEAVALLARALRPFILRRTKAQVAKDLPERLEETRMIELEGPQRALYDDLRSHYRASLEERLAKDGIARSKMHVLEALLRLRQAACHPGLVDPNRRGERSAKLEVLFDELPGLREKGHKALVFSQFTSLLALVRERLDAEGVPYAYLDGQTRDREARVERFQTDPGCPLFLVSLKAGGLGLNLTAAEYVFLLDPWWNPATEAQAIDRAHRIGQARSVFAYRLIAKDTIEEHIAELQRRKKKLAESVIEGDGGMLRELTAEDLALLLS